MDTQTSLPRHCEDPQKVLIKVQQRLEAKILKTVRLQSPVKPTILEDTIPVHFH
jgi:hypothetical protein